MSAAYKVAFSLAKAIAVGIKLVEVEDKDVGSDSTTQTFSGLDGDTDGTYLMLGMLKNSSSSDCRILFNNDATGFAAKSLNGNGAAASSGSPSHPINRGASDEHAFFIAFIRARSGNKRRILGFSCHTSILQAWSIEWPNTADNVTSLVVEADAGGQIKAGSKIALYKFSGVLT